MTTPRRPRSRSHLLALALFAFIVCAHADRAHAAIDCGPPAEAIKGLYAATAGLLAIPTYFAPDTKISVAPSVTTAGPSARPTSDPAGVGLQGEMVGHWGQFGFAVSWSHTQQGLAACGPWTIGWIAPTFSYRLRPRPASSLRLVLGPDLGHWPGGLTSVGAHAGVRYETPLAQALRFGARADYRLSYLGARPQPPSFTHPLELGLRLQASPGHAVEPYLEAIGGVTGTRRAQMGEPTPLGESDPGLYVGGAIGLELRWYASTP